MIEQGMAKGERDRRGFLRGAAAAVAAVGTGAVLFGSPHAVAANSRDGKAVADPLPFPVPPLGVDVPFSMYAANVPLKVNILGALTADFKGGINVHVRTSTEDEVVLEVQGFRVEADLSPSTPGSGTLIAMTMSNATLTPLSVLRTAAGGGVEARVYLSLTVEVIDKATGETITTLSTDPTKYATLRATDIKTFPWVNQLFTLQEPVALYPQGGSEAQGTEPAGQLDGFDSIWNQSA